MTLNWKICDNKFKESNTPKEKEKLCHKRKALKRKFVQFGGVFLNKCVPCLNSQSKVRERERGEGKKFNGSADKIINVIAVDAAAAAFFSLIFLVLWCSIFAMFLKM